MTRRLIEQFREGSRGSSGLRPIKGPLTPREWEVIDLLTPGHSTDQVAESRPSLPRNGAFSPQEHHAQTRRPLPQGTRSPPPNGCGSPHPRQPPDQDPRRVASSVDESGCAGVAGEPVSLGRVAVLTEMSGDRPTVVIVKANGGTPVRHGIRRPGSARRLALAPPPTAIAAAAPVGAACGRPRARAGHGARGGRLRRRRRVRERPGGAGAMRPRIPARTDPREQHVRRGVRRLAPRRRAVDAEPRARAARAHVAVAAEGDGGDRGRAVLDARRRARPAGDHARGGRRRPGREGRRGRLDDPRSSWRATGTCALRRRRCRASSRRRAWRRSSSSATPGARSCRTTSNDAYYGHHAYGVQAAAETYFSRPADRLTMAQAALLAGLPQAPTVFDPLEHPAAARRRRARGARRAARLRGDLGAARSGGRPRPAASAARRALRRRLGRSRSSSTPGAS